MKIIKWKLFIIILSTISLLPIVIDFTREKIAFHTDSIVEQNDCIDVNTAHIPFYPIYQCKDKIIETKINRNKDITFLMFVIYVFLVKVLIPASLIILIMYQSITFTINLIKNK